MPHVQQTTPDGVQADVAACVAHLRAAGCTSIFTVGFCFGGRNAWLAAASGHDLCRRDRLLRPARAGQRRLTGTRRNERRSSRRRSSVSWAATTPGSRSRTRRRSTRPSPLRAIEHEIVIYPGAPHSFFDRKQEEFADASEDAWSRVLAFLERYA